MGPLCSSAGGPLRGSVPLDIFSRLPTAVTTSTVATSCLERGCCRRGSSPLFLPVPPPFESPTAGRTSGGAAAAGVHGRAHPGFSECEPGGLGGAARAANGRELPPGDEGKAAAEGGFSGDVDPMKGYIGQNVRRVESPKLLAGLENLNRPLFFTNSVSNSCLSTYGSTYSRPSWRAAGPGGLTSRSDTWFWISRFLVPTCGPGPVTSSSAVRP